MKRKRNSAYLILSLALILLMLTGCGYDAEKVVCRGKTDSTYDDTCIIAPDGYFLNGYEWVDVDGNTKHLIITMTKENGGAEE